MDSISTVRTTHPLKNMKIKDLILLLQKQDPERVVVIAKGKKYSPLDSLMTCAYGAETAELPGYISVELSDINDEMRAQGFNEEVVMKDGVPAIVMYPTN